ncbi:MAG: CoA-binding domain-containing protein [Syntrophaceae bacterium]|nr:MAG: CoA-binding domain-containing protein [Syntrophaceae bacterium]
MTSTEQLLQQIDEILHPRSVAIIGVPRGMKTGKLFFMALLDQGFSGEIYPVSPQADEIDGYKAYPSVAAIPGAVDLAIILVPQYLILPAVKECAAKGIKGAVLFTAGYKELGTDEGRAQEEQLVQVASASGMRLIGPNCMGIYAPRSGLSFFPQLTREAGPVGLVSHSGSLANILCRMAPQRGIRFSKAISLGNECDLTSTDFLLYLGNDAETQLIGAYIEGIKDGPRFFDALRTASLKKPVILWKVGLTSAGAQAAASHTGALAVARDVWEGVVRQTGAVPVIGFEAWFDALMGFAMLPEHLGDRIAIISGPGGLAVSAAEACANNGLRLAQLSPETHESLAKVVPPTGTSLHNPIDVGLTASLEIGIYIQSIQTVVADPAVDAVVIIGAGLTPEANRLYTEAVIETRRQSGKAILMVNLPGFDSSYIPQFCDASIPYFESSERAMSTYARVRRYQHWRKKQR